AAVQPLAHPGHIGGRLDLGHAQAAGEAADRRPVGCAGVRAGPVDADPRRVAGQRLGDERPRAGLQVRRDRVLGVEQRLVGARVEDARQDPLAVAWAEQPGPDHCWRSLYVLMRLAFTTLACPAWSLERVVEAAHAHGYAGVELRLLDGETIEPGLGA